MEFEWDTEKAEANFAKHGVSSEVATDLDWANALIVPQVVAGEPRFAALVPLGDRLRFCAYVDRGGTRRIISLRKANRREVHRYLEVSE